MLLKRKPSQNNRSHKPSENPLGKRSAGNLHAAFDEAEAGNVTRREAEFATTEFVVTLGKSIESARQLSTLLDKIGKRDIQYYIKNGEWYLIFNSSPSLERTVEVKVPQYFLEGDDVTTAR